MIQETVVLDQVVYFYLHDQGFIIRFLLMAKFFYFHHHSDHTTVTSKFFSRQVGFLILISYFIQILAVGREKDPIEKDIHFVQ